MKLVSIIIVNYNGKKFLEKCFDSIYAQTYKDFEIIFVDNNSQDGSIDFVSSKYPEIKIVQTGQNLGYAGGNNVGIQHSNGEYILIMNNDTYLEQDFLEKILKSFDEIPNLGAVQPKLVLAKEQDKLDVCGTYWLDFCIALYHYGFRKDKNLDIYNKTMQVFANKGACMMTKREIINKVGLFFDEYWCYYEETDFCHRLWLSGYECWYYPKTTCYHENGGTAMDFDNSYIQYHNLKNRLSSFIQNFEIITLLYMIPIFLILSVLLSIFWLLTLKPKFAWAVYQAIGWNIVNLKNTLEKRKSIQKLRKKTDKDIFKLTKRYPKISYYFQLFRGNLEEYKD